MRFGAPRLQFAILFTFLNSIVLAQAPITCTANAGVPPLLRVAGVAEAAGDIVIDCTGGTPVAPGLPLPGVNLQVFLNANLTSRIVFAGANSWSEALLLVDDPQPAAQVPCLDASGSCTVLSGAAAPNVFQGMVVGENSVAFLNVPLNPPGDSAHRLLRITNLRVNANQLGYVAPPPAEAVAFLSLSGGVALAIANPEVVIGFTSPAVDPKVLTSDGSAVLPQPASLQSCLRMLNQRVAVLRFGETSVQMFKARAVPAPERQNVPGRVYGTESIFNPAFPATQASRNIGLSGLASSGTRLRARFTNVPAGISIHVASVPVTMTMGAPVVNPPNAIQAAIVSPGTVDGSNDGIPVTAIPLSGGTGEAVWEVTQANQGLIENLDFPVYVSYAAGAPGLGAATVALGLAPPTSEFGASLAAPVPRFIDSFTSSTGIFSVVGTCACPFTFTPTAADVSSAGGAGVFLVGCPFGCEWLAVSTAPWITVPAYLGGAGPGRATYSVSANPSTAPRSGTITAGGATFTINQAGAPCTYSLSTTGVAFGAMGGSGLLDVTSSAGCAWAAVSDAAWLTVTAGASGTGSGTVAFSASVNPSASPRSGSIRVGGQTFTLTQTGYVYDEPATTVFIGAPFNHTLSTVPATSNPNDPVHGCGSRTRDSATVWYRFIANATGRITISTLGSNYDTVLSVYSGGAAPGAELACNDNFTAATSQVTLSVVSGQSYFVEISGYGPSSNGGNLVLTSTIIGGPRIDINRDGKPDLLWQHPANGDVWWWTLDGAAVQNYGYIGWNATYRLAVSGDFNADGHTDFIVQHPSTGEAFVWFLNAGAYSSYAPISGPTAWRIAGASDFNGDGQLDLLWQLPGTSQAWVWFMNGAAYSSGQPVLGSASYRVAATGDVNGDGHPDILWQHPVNRDVWVWYMNGANYVSSARLTGPQTYDVAGTGDFNADGKLDLLWQHPANGDVWVWHLDQGAFLSHAAVSGPMAYKVFGWK